MTRRPLTSAEAKAFVRRHTTLRPVPGLAAAPGLAGIRLHLADDILAVWRQTQVATADDDAPLPYWAVAWAGGLALASYLRDQPDAVAGRRVLDFGSGSGLVAIAAAQAGAIAVTAVDIDPLAVAAVALNARANGVRVSPILRDLLDEDGPPPNVALVLAADCWYEAGFGGRATAWLRRTRDAGIDVLIGDPGRRYLPAEELAELAAYAVRTTADLEDLAQRSARVYRLER